MKKNFSILFFLHLCSVILLAYQTNIYTKSPIVLEADPAFAQGTNWAEIFADTETRKKIITRKSLVISEDGSIFVSDYSRYKILKFDKNGTLLKEFGRKGGRQEDFIKRPEIPTILDNSFLVVPSYQGYVHIFDLEGRFIKLLRIDYLVLDARAAQNGSLAVAGNVPYAGSKYKKIFTLKSMETEKEKVVSYDFEDYGDRSSSFGNISVCGKTLKIQISPVLPTQKHFVRPRPDGNLIYGNTASPEITVYSLDGEESFRFSMNIRPLEIEEQVKKEFIALYNQSDKSAKEWLYTVAGCDVENGIPEDEIVDLEKIDIHFPQHLPYYYHMETDTEGNLLVFLYTEEEGFYPFQVYSPEGQYICTSAIDPGDYEVRISTSLAFSRGALYAVVSPKNSPVYSPKIIKVDLGGTY